MKRPPRFHPNYGRYARGKPIHRSNIRRFVKGMTKGAERIDESVFTDGSERPEFDYEEWKQEQQNKPKREF